MQLDQADAPLAPATQAPGSPNPHHSPPGRSGSFSGTKPRGILKNPASQSGVSRALLWNEENLALNEVQKDSTMKITEPKTPYVRYNAETDEVMDLDKIPGFELGKAEEMVTDTDYPMSGETPPSPARSSGFSSAGGSRRGSEASEKMVKVEAPGPSSGEEDDDDELLDEETRAHRKKFAQMRGGHYKNEAEAMKRAQALLAEEDESSGGDGAVPPVPPFPAQLTVNGSS